jgi:hypothetical protein
VYSLKSVVSREPFPISYPTSSHSLNRQPFFSNLKIPLNYMLFNNVVLYLQRWQFHTNSDPSRWEPFFAHSVRVIPEVERSEYVYNFSRPSNPIWAPLITLKFKNIIIIIIYIYSPKLYMMREFTSSIYCSIVIGLRWMRILNKL